MYICVHVHMKILIPTSSFCLSETIEMGRDILLFDVNMSIGTSENELSSGDGTGKGKSKDAPLPLFSFTSISTATNSFCSENKLGEGGFGPVYKVGQ